VGWVVGCGGGFVGVGVCFFLVVKSWVGVWGVWVGGVVFGGWCGGGGGFLGGVGGLGVVVVGGGGDGGGWWCCLGHGSVGGGV